MICINANSPISCLIELKDSCNKVANEKLHFIHPLIHFIIHACVDGVTKIVEHWLPS
jgi:hypothetical protein